ncbi:MULTISPECIES: DNA cytosine methyltransferase [Ramlibacter]|uniref:DNA cytosine methyltransferase n=1 Tax=Ramlibacter aquaticus TaxID=2780094 RepID=A0ABR9SES7_9BURK|nr:MULTISPECIES: DNA cytosine methyltransferase [Ramlibacter]MBE7940801.1 DNA cytosine methyltransferase [Ramlibacter aquaticus]
MRARLVFIVLAVVLVGGFAWQNWPEITRDSTLTFGIVQTTLPLGLVLLGALAVVLAVFLFSSAVQESRHLLDQRRQSRALQAQRDLAEKAEASRYTELRQHIDSRLGEVRTQGTLATSEFERAMMQGQRELRTQLEQVLHVLASRLGDLEARLAASPLAAGPAQLAAADAERTARAAARDLGRADLTRDRVPL